MNQKYLGLMLGGVILIGVVVFMFFQFRNTLKETEIILHEASVEITGNYGFTFNLVDIDSIELKDTLPNQITKTNGSSLGEVKKGNFDVEGLGDCKLYIHSNSGPFIYIKLNNTYVIINYQDVSKTQQLYENISEKIENK